MSVMAGEKTDPIRWHQKNTNRGFMGSAMKPSYSFARFLREQNTDASSPLFSLSCLSSVKVMVMFDFYHSRVIGLWHNA